MRTDYNDTHIIVFQIYWSKQLITPQYNDNFSMCTITAAKQNTKHYYWASPLQCHPKGGEIYIPDNDIILLQESFKNLHTCDRFIFEQESHLNIFIKSHWRNPGVYKNKIHLLIFKLVQNFTRSDILEWFARELQIYTVGI
jgi:hypothetical protein